MSYFSSRGVKICGISAAVPSIVEENRSLKIFRRGEVDKFIASTGVERRHVSKTLLSSDLCVAAAERMITDIGWDRSTIDGLVVVTQTPDYQRPANATLIQHRLSLSQECAAISVSYGCSGWVYGLMVASGMVMCGAKRVLLCCGEGIQAYNPLDKSTYPLFGSAGTCTALESNFESAELKFHLASDGSGGGAICVPDGGYRRPYGAESSVLQEFEGGIRRTNADVALDGMSVFSFGISRPPKSIKALCEHFNLSVDSIDYLLLHQANLLLNTKIAKKVGVPLEKVPHNIEDFGNSSSATIPLLMVTRLRKQLVSGIQRFIGCAFGVGLSWGSVYFETDKPIISELEIVEEPDAKL